MAFDASSVRVSPRGLCELDKLLIVREQVLLLLDDALAAGSTWDPDEDKSAFLRILAELSGPPLPPSAVSDPADAARFLRAARARLDAMIWRLKAFSS